MKRSPIVVVMGHVDHGKTTLLDYIRKTSVAAKEAGGITQSVGAYEITHNSQLITFIDTPGHEAFSKMRSRGAKVADIAILVVAADDSVKPQTKEAIKIIKNAKTPFIVAINKIDKAPENVERVKNDLMKESVLLEGFGGDISYHPISAKTGQGVNELLDLILLTAETAVEDLNYDPSAPAKGFILESKLEAKQGIMATAILKDGTLKTGDEISTGSAAGRIKILKNFLGEKIDSAIPSSPVRILGFETLPKVGDEFIVGGKVKAAGLEVRLPNIDANVRKSDLPVNSIRVILKGDVSGSLEALAEVVRNLPKPEGAALEIIDESVGDISDGDVKLAISTKAIIIGFRVKVAKPAESLAKSQGAKIVQSEIIYELIKAVEEMLKGAGKEQVRGDLEILAVFGKKQGKQIVGGKVVVGEIRNNAVVEIQKKGQVVGSGKIINLQQAKRDAQKVEAGNECGLLMDTKTAMQVGDHLILR